MKEGHEPRQPGPVDRAGYLQARCDDLAGALIMAQAALRDVVRTRSTDAWGTAVDIASAALEGIDASLGDWCEEAIKR